MNIRPATLYDKHAIFEIAKEQVARYPLKLDVQKLNDAVIEAISSPRHYTYVVENKGAIDGVLVGLTSDNLWAQRQNCNISLWASKVPGGGAALLRHFRDWVKSRRAIKVAGMSPDLDIDLRALRLAERIGFTKHGGAYLLYN